MEILHPPRFWLIGLVKSKSVSTWFARALCDGSLIHGTAELELCQRENSGTKSCRRDLQNFGEIIMYLVTKINQPDRQPDVNRYSPQVLDFVGQTVSTTARDLGQVRNDLVLSG